MAKIYKLKDLKNDLKDEKINQLRELFPESFVDNEFSIDALLDSLGLSDSYETDKSFGLNWVGKKEAKKLANLGTNATLKPNFKKSVDFDNNENIIIEGDNLEVLKVLHKSYWNKIDVIYIDPPYNTGNDFVYNDNFAQNDKEYKASSGQIDENGNKTTSNQKSDGKYHTNWLNMMYPRLVLARQLLKDDGVIFISIDDNEQSRLKLICDEIFGEENFVTTFIWERTFHSNKNNSGKKIFRNSDYILCYTKSLKLQMLNEGIKTNFDDAPLKNNSNTEKELIFPKNTVFFKDLKSWNVEEIKLKFKSRWSQNKINSEIDNGTTFIVKDSTNLTNIRVKYSDDKIGYIIPNQLMNTSKIFINKYDLPTTERGTKELEQLGLKNLFSYPKPIQLLIYLFNLLHNDKLLVLDFFAGSGTTGQAIMELNKEDNGNRKFILVQIPELIDDKKQTQDFKYISDITRERIKRSIEMYDYKEKGFKYFELTDTNFNLFNPNEDIQMSLMNFKQTLKDNTNIDDLLYELIIKEGLGLNTKIIKKDILNNTVYVDDTNTIVFCIDKKKYSNIENTIIEIYKQNNSMGYLSVWLLDDYFESNLDKDKCLRALEQLSGDVKVWIM